MFAVVGKLKTSRKSGKSIEKHQNMLKIVEKRMFFYGFGRLPIEIKPELHFEDTK